MLEVKVKPNGNKREVMSNGVIQTRITTVSSIFANLRKILWNKKALPMETKYKAKVVPAVNSLLFNWFNAKKISKDTVGKLVITKLSYNPQTDKLTLEGYFIPYVAQAKITI